jgi:hypothetical protein
MNEVSLPSLSTGYEKCMTRRKQDVSPCLSVVTLSPEGLYLGYEAAARLSIPYYRVHDSVQDMGEHRATKFFRQLSDAASSLFPPPP